MKTRPIARDVRGPIAPHEISTKIELKDGAQTTVHIAVHPRRTTELRVVVFPAPQRLVDWCQQTGINPALTGGFFSRQSGKPIGRLWMRGTAIDSEPFGKRWADHRGALHTLGSQIRIAPLKELPHYPVGDLLTAGPILVRDGRSLITSDYHFEGIPETWEGELDDDWTQIRAQRSAVGYDSARIWAVTCDGTSTNADKEIPGHGIPDAGLTIKELAEVMVGLGAKYALNLDGGGGSSLVFNGRLINRPRAGRHDKEYAVGEMMPSGRPIHTALTFLTKPENLL